MAKRPYFTISNYKVISRSVDFEWFAGFSCKQKQLSIESMHKASGKELLEVSTKSQSEIGRKLSAFSLQVYGYKLENVFQAGKIFESGGPYTDLLNVSPKEAKRDLRLHNSGKIKAFVDLDGYIWENEPKTAFYDYLYIKAVEEGLSKAELVELVKYDGYSDIEFNPKKSVNTQARSVAIVKLFFDIFGDIPDLNNKEEFVQFHKDFVVL